MSLSSAGWYIVSGYQPQIYIAEMLNLKWNLIKITEFSEMLTGIILDFDTCVWQCSLVNLSFIDLQIFWLACDVEQWNWVASCILHTSSGIRDIADIDELLYC